MIIPVVPLRDVVIYPHIVIPLFIGRTGSIQALEIALTGAQQILLVAQKESDRDDPVAVDLFTTGTIANVLQLMKLPDGTLKVLIEGVDRCEVMRYITDQQPYLMAKVEKFSTWIAPEVEVKALLRTLVAIFEQYAQYSSKLPIELFMSLAAEGQDPVRLVDMIAAHMPLKMADKQHILEIKAFKERVECLIALIASEIELLAVESRIMGDVKRQMEKNHREYYLQEKMRAIQKELGAGQESKYEIEHLTQKIEQSGMPEAVKAKALSEIQKLKMMPVMAAEAAISRNYVDCLISMPWQVCDKVCEDLNTAERILNAEHYGLEKVKERILEYLAVQLRVAKTKGPILCLVGPPGVGKTSLGESIARATGRQFIRMSLGGVRDEAEIRGHRRTYIGAMPGKILQKMAKVGVKNPLFLLDEIDKMAMDFRGDPASALLEVLDPEQNKTFNDHYLEVDYDLSEVMFIATANSISGIPLPLLDRMEMIRLSGYTEMEKCHIAEQYLIPKQLANHGVVDQEVTITRDAVLDMIRYYTRESGVRNLERELSKIARKRVKEILIHKKRIAHKTMGPRDLEKYLGVQRFHFGRAEATDQVGQVMGLAWTEVGGETLTIEAVSVPGKGKITCTGQLGEVMQESIHAAMTVVRHRSVQWGISEEYFEKHDIHIHVPEGATPKDGPSAGIGMCVVLASILKNIPIHKDVAMTGEITLRGQVLPIGGLKEKLLAARRAGIQRVILPKENMRELKEISKEVYEGLRIYPVRTIEKVFKLALVDKLKSSMKS
jgi:ATP-dependent Lon protease